MFLTSLGNSTISNQMHKLGNTPLANTSTTDPAIIRLYISGLFSVSPTINGCPYMTGSDHNA